MISYSQETDARSKKRTEGRRECPQRAHQGKSPEGEIMEILGRTGEAGVDILAYARRFGLVSRFPDACKGRHRPWHRKKWSLRGAA